MDGQTKVFEGRAAIGYDHGHDAQGFYLGLALDPKYVEGFVEGCLERNSEDHPEGEALLRSEWEDGGDRDFVVEAFKSGVESGWADLWGFDPPPLGLRSLWAANEAGTDHRH